MPCQPLLPDAASSDEEPPSARKHRQRQAAAAAGDDDDEADAYARALLARAAGKAAPAARPGARGTASFYGASGASGSGNLERRVSMGQSEDELRSKVGREGEGGRERGEEEGVGGGEGERDAAWPAGLNRPLFRGCEERLPAS